VPQALQVPVAVVPTSLRLLSTPLPVSMRPSFTQQAVHDYARQRGAPYFTCGLGRNNLMASNAFEWSNAALHSSPITPITRSV
jgi:hypothetical protein